MVIGAVVLRLSCSAAAWYATLAALHSCVSGFAPLTQRTAFV